MRVSPHVRGPQNASARCCWPFVRLGPFPARQVAETSVGPGTRGLISDDTDTGMPHLGGLMKITEQFHCGEQARHVDVVKVMARGGVNRPSSAGAREFVAPYSHGERPVRELARFNAAPAPCSTGTEGRNRRCVACDAQSDRTDANGNIEAA